MNRRNKAPTKETAPVELSYMENLKLRDAVVKLVNANLYLKFNGSWDNWHEYVKHQEIFQTIHNIEDPLQQRRSYANKFTPTVWNVSTSDQLSVKTKLLQHQQRLNKVHKFYKWASDNGVHYDGFKIQKFPDLQSGLVTEQDINKDKLILTIPRKLMLSEENLEYKLPIRFPNINLVLALMEETLQPDSFWRPYIDILPNSYNTVLYFTIEEMSEF